MMYTFQQIFNMISKSMNAQINLIFSLISIDSYPVSTKRRFDVVRRCLVLVV